MNTHPEAKQRLTLRGRGLINPDKVRWATFCTVTLCILVSGVACILAIWDFTQNDALWRTVATCVVVAAGMMAFGVVNALYGVRAGDRGQA